MATLLPSLRLFRVSTSSQRHFDQQDYPRQCIHAIYEEIARCMRMNGMTNIYVPVLQPFESTLEPFHYLPSRHYCQLNIAGKYNDMVQ